MDWVECSAYHCLISLTDQCKWEDWSWQVKLFVTLYKAQALAVLEESESRATEVTDEAITQAETALNEGDWARMRHVSRPFDPTFPLTTSLALSVVKLASNKRSCREKATSPKRFHCPDRPKT